MVCSVLNGITTSYSQPDGVARAIDRFLHNFRHKPVDFKKSSLFFAGVDNDLCH
jgi:hypothetical protein